MRLFGRKLGFTLMEVNLAIFIMAAGVLAMVALYPLAFRESEQSKDDVKAAAAADAVLNTIAGALSSRNITWNDWRNKVDQAVRKTGTSTRTGGWMAYCDQQNNSYSPKKKGMINSLAKQVFGSLVDAYDGRKPSWPVNDDLCCALVAQWGRKPVQTSGGGRSGAVVQQQLDYSRVALSFRCSRNANSLFAAPIFYTEIHFQGDQKDMQ